MKKIFFMIIKAYQYFISPLMGKACRFYPSCSCYAIEAIEHFGILRGSFLTLKRLAKCHPWHRSGGR